MFGHLLKRGAAMLCFAAVLALPAYAEGRITTDMTMKEIRSDPAIEVPPNFITMRATRHSLGSPQEQQTRPLDRAKSRP